MHTGGDEARDRKHVQNVLEHVSGAHLSSPIPLIVEVDKTAVAQILRRENLLGLLAGTIGELLTRVFEDGFIKDKKVKLCPAEGRAEISDLLPQILSQVGENAMPFVKPARLALKILANDLRSEVGV